ncbi:MAG: dihydrofolate reductase [Puniceicoccales bacterium]
MKKKRESSIGAPPGLDLRAIAAVSRNGVIGIDGGLPWDLPEDRQYLADCVRGGVVLEGRRCYESRGRPFPGAKRTLVLSRHSDSFAEDVEVYPSLAQAYDALEGETAPVWVMGGERLYRESLPHWRKLYLTWIDADFDGDTRFPDWNQRFVKQICRIDSHEGDLRYSFLVLAPEGQEKEGAL